MVNTNYVLFISSLICMIIQVSLFLKCILVFDKSILKENVKTLDVAKLKFDAYLKDFNKTYYGFERDGRFENFKNSLKNIARSNALEGRTVFGLTKFSDMSQREFMNTVLDNYMDFSMCTKLSLDCVDNYETSDQETVYDEEPPSSFDWRPKRVVKPILNQKKCLGCWAFGIVGVVESMSAIRGLDHKSRSIQEVLDCSEYTNGCRGGSVSRALRYLCQEKVPIVTEQEYPLTLGLEKDCKLAPHSTGRLIRHFDYQCKVSETVMMSQIAFHGPLIATVDATNWINYIGGVIQRACTRGIANHVVQIVGYVQNAEIPYFIVRNSLGEDFGENGYVKVAMFDNICGIADRVTKLDVM
nr:cathepsin O-like [Helicoverpa armigera]